MIALHLYLDWESLQAFSLVGREWRAASRSFVFQNITIDSHFMTLAELQKVLDADSSFGPLIRAVKLSFVEPSLRTQELECWLPYFPEVLCQRLPNVHSLELKCLPRCPFLPQFPQQLSGITSITSLILVNCDFLGGVLVDFASALPQLQDLQIHSHQDVIYDSDMTVIGNTSRPMTQLRSVTYHRPELDAFLEWIGPIIAPTSLGVNVGHPESLSRLGALLRRLGGALQHLELRILYKTWNEDFCKYVIHRPRNTLVDSTFTSQTTY